MKLSKDKSALAVNPSLTLAGIPPETFRYRLVKPASAAPAPLHLDEGDRLPNGIGEGDAAVVGFLDAHFERRACFHDSLLAEALEKPVEEELGFFFFIPLDVLGGPSGEFSQALAAIFLDSRHNRTAARPRRKMPRYTIVERKSNQRMTA